jgi:hypothetical protein
MAKRMTSKEKTRPITLRKSKLVQDILLRPNQMKYGAIPIAELAIRHSNSKGHETPQWEVTRTLKHIMHYLSTEPNTKQSPVNIRKSKHEYYTENKHEREKKLFENKQDKKNYLRTTALVHEHLKLMSAHERKKIISAANEYLSGLLNNVYSAERRKRVAKLIDYAYPRISRKATRHKIIHEFLEKMRGTTPNTKIADQQYEAIKKDLYALSYATLPLPNGTKTSPADVVESHREDYMKTKDAIDKGYISKAKATKVSKWFLEHAPNFDLERMRQEHPTNNPETHAHQEIWAEEINNYAKTLRELKNWHPAKAYGRAWQLGGLKLHLELPKIEENIKKIRDTNANEIREKAIRLVWEENTHRVIATHTYAKAWITLRNTIDEYGSLMSSKEREAYENAVLDADKNSGETNTMLIAKNILNNIPKITESKHKRTNELHNKLITIRSSIDLAEQHLRKARKLNQENKFVR